MLGVTWSLNMKRLTNACARFEASQEAASSLMVKKTALEILSDFQKAAPVDPGSFRAGWAPYLLQEGGPGVEGGDSSAAAEGRASGEIEEGEENGVLSLVIGNGVAYGEALEDGRSPQAPAGFHQSIVDRHAADLGGTEVEFQR